ncbi:DUF255 domain-containing protein [uncultured Polaribacter sp.]|uniref:thioredoxin family protein n=1 Tax=uncultured Polaribacter sp. TaxID=174711 RepID=UPI002625CA5E|nr:DUF255 domain-containing protein [uncultured Polaribacter sp.]
MKFTFGFLLLCFVIFSSDEIKAQNQKINWLTFEQLEDSLAVKPKKVFINFYADWCAYCKKMDAAAFKNQTVINLLNTNFYAVKMDAEYKENISFGGKVFKNKEIGKSRRPTHEIPKLLGQRPNANFSLPLTLILNPDFTVLQRDFQYISSKKMIAILEEANH